METSPFLRPSERRGSECDPAGAADGFNDTTARSLTKVTATAVTFYTPADQAAIDQVTACGISGCSAPLAKDDTYTYYPLGTPQVSSASPSSGKAATTVTINGENLGFIEAVYFGKVRATKFANIPALLDCGSTTQITAVAPAATTGVKVEIRVVTLESKVTGTEKSAPTRTRYSPIPVRQGRP